MLLECHPSSYLGEAAGQKPGIDMDAGGVVDQVPGHHQPPDSPADHALFGGDVADGEGPFPHPRQAGGMDDRSPVEEDSLEPRPVDEPQVTARRHLRDGLPLVM